MFCFRYSVYWSDTWKFCLAFQLVMPGEKEEIQIFQEKAVNNTLLLIDFSLPNVNIQLPSKLFLEVLYNRSVWQILPFSCLSLSPSMPTSIPPKCSMPCWVLLASLLSLMESCLQQDRTPCCRQRWKKKSFRCWAVLLLLCLRIPPPSRQPQHC